MAVEKMSPLTPDLTMPIVMFIIVSVIHVFFALLGKKNLKQIFCLLLRTGMLFFPVFAAEIFPAMLKGSFSYEEELSIKAKLSTLIFLFGEMIAFIPIVRKVKEQQRIASEEYHKQMHRV